MASYASPLSFFFSFFIILALSSSLQTQARESRYFSKFSHKPATLENNETNTIPSTTKPEAAPESEPESEPAVVEHGYGLYGRDNYQYPPTTINPVKNGPGQKRFVSLDQIRKEMNEKTNNGYVSEKQGMSDTRFLEKGRYFYDINQESEGNKQGMNEFIENTGNNNYNYNGYDDEYEKQGMSDTRFYQGNNKYGVNKQGMSDTRFLENGRYYFDMSRGGNGQSLKNKYDQNELFETEEELNEKSNNYNYKNESESESESENEKNGYENPNEYEFNGNTRKLPPNQYDTMEQYEKEEEYRLSNKYHP